jgi:hypothetical protein
VVASLVGLGVGLLWLAVAPRVEIVRVEQGFVYADSEPEQAVAADGWFALLGLAAGLVIAVIAWSVLRRHRGLFLLVAMVLGSLVGAWLGWWFAVWLDADAFRALAASAQVGDHLGAPLSLGMTGLDHDRLWPPKVTGVVLAQPLMVAIAYTTIAGFSSDPQLRPASERLAQRTEQGYADWAMTWPPAPVSEPVRPDPERPSSGQGGPVGPTGWPAPPGSG